MKFSLNKKTILLIVCIAVVISILSIVIYNKGIHDVIESQYEDRSIDIANLVAVEIDTERLEKVQRAVREIYNQIDSADRVMSDQWGTPEFEAYVAHYASVEEMEEYQTLRADLRRMQDVLDVDCLYITWLNVVDECNVYLVDAAYEDACPIGCIDRIYIDDPEVLVHREEGFEPNITNTPEYGWIIATGMPIRNERGEILAISAVDISMNEIMEKQHRYLIYVALAFFGLTILVCFLGIVVVNRVIVRPINKLSQAAAQYKNNRNVFSELHMSRGDEIGDLADSMTLMEDEINGYISNLEKTTNDLISAREHAEQMDRAANIDALTKVRNKRAFDVETNRLDGSTPYGILMVDMNGLKFINDTYGHEKGDIGINTVCQTVCQIFKHSPVYRVGGDEFVVVLEGISYAERDALVQSLADAFRRITDDDSRQPWERVMAAAGYAVYDPETDSGVDSVLKRADAAMYENKRALKEAR